VLRATLSISPDSTHIRRMAKSPEKTTRPAQDDRAAKPKRRSPLTDFMDAAEPLHRGGFAEAPQAEFTGAPLTGSISDWAEQISREAEKEGRQVISPLEGEMSAKPTEGGAPSAISRTPPSALPDISPSRGEISSSNDDLLTIVRRVEALGSFLDSEDGRNLLAGTKRAANILAAEEKKGTAVAAAVDPALFRDEAEKVLFAAVNQAERQAGQAIGEEDFSAAMRALSALREPVDSFFEKVLVNDEDAAVRANRLALLSRIRAATGQVADFSKIAG
jgi:hypothetical protein